MQSISFLLETACSASGRRVLEFVLVIGILLWRYPVVFALITSLTIAAYAVFTIVTTNWRTRFRREMNERDNEFSGQAVDGLINYEVVKAFANEGCEAAAPRPRAPRLRERRRQVADHASPSSTPARPRSSRSASRRS